MGLTDPTPEAMALWRKAINIFYETDSDDLARTKQHEAAARIIDEEFAATRDALRILAAERDMLPPDHDCEDLFERELLAQRRDITDEWVCYMTHKGARFVEATLNGDRPCPEPPAGERT